MCNALDHVLKALAKPPRAKRGASGDYAHEETVIGNNVIGRYESEKGTHYVAITPIPTTGPRYVDDPLDICIHMPCADDGKAIALYAILTSGTFVTGIEWRYV